jgi:hypothetical protein
MCTALVLEADGRRENGRWKRGSVIQISGLAEDRESAWQEKLRCAGIVLDFKPDLAPLVVSGVVWGDDSQVVALLASKRVAELGEQPGVSITAVHDL